MDSDMNNFIIDMKSLTQAEKARAFLAKKGIQSVVERSFGGSGTGCGFVLRVLGGANVSRGEVCDLLKMVGVNCDISR